MDIRLQEIMHTKSFVLLLTAFTLLFGLICDVAAQPLRRTKHPYSVAKTLTEPTIFAEGVISNGAFDSHPSFTPDGKTLYFVRSTPNFNFWTIVFSKFVNAKWSQPEVAPFSGQYSDADPFITKDGKRLYFISRRPKSGTNTTDLDIWYVEKKGDDSWGAPVNPGVPINSPGSEWYPTLTRDGSIYFGSDRQGGRGATDIYRSRMAGGTYTEPENLGEIINTNFNEFEPYISPDETFLIFMGGGRAEGRGGFDLYLSYNRDGVWTAPTNLGDKINSSGNEYSPSISPDGKYFFWTSSREFAGKPADRRYTIEELMKRLQGPGNGLGDIYQIDVSMLGILP